ncbi:MAG: DUF411 domain-containing protein [Magnetococcales bacterium]|nr:DUF411 domain-containing protein [Magnetococcales bacterium]
MGNHKQLSWKMVLIGALIMIGTGWFFFPGKSQAQPDMIVYKSASCGCCGNWIEYLEKNGFKVKVENVEDIYRVKKELGVPNQVASCHTAKMGSYLIEGHVPVEDINRLIKEKPVVSGIAAPGMPMGSPGMEVEGEQPDRYDVVTFTRNGQTQVFSRH